ncbi:MAG TPA: hypothetical protein VKA21_13580, partial [Candidatus Binatia bacterium]|nr:hypothetical protein [Candidatus Binatia bacterium]
MRKRRWLFAALAVAAVTLALPVARDWYLSRTATLGTLAAMPEGPHVSVRIGETVQFSAAAEGAIGFTWLVWGSPVATTPSWTFTPAPADAGWRQVTVEVRGRRGLRVSRTWDVGVIAAAIPEIDALDPPAGPVGVGVGERATFRARAHLPAARATDRLTFEWSLDDRPMLRDEHAAGDASSELVLPAGEAGPHRLRLRVTEDGRTASLADWTIDVGGTVVARTAPPPEPLPFVGPPEGPQGPPAPPLPRLLLASGPRRMEMEVGAPVVLETRVEPADADVTYRWSIDGTPIAEEKRLFEYVPTAPGRHRVTLAVATGSQTLGTDAWVLEVHARPA